MSGAAEPSLKKLYLRLTTYERPPKQPKIFSVLYFSFRFLGLEYFSSEMPLFDPDGRLQFEINDHFVWVLDSEVAATEPIEVTRWEDHLSVFTFTVQLGQVLNKQFLRKRLETKPQDYLNMTVAVLEDRELLLLDRKTNEIAHYFSVDKLELQPTREQAKADQAKTEEAATAPSFLTVLAGKKKYTLPDGVHNRCLVLQLPCKIKFEYYRYGQLLCKSEVLDSNEYLRKVTKIGLMDVSSGSRAAFLEFEGRWGYNFSSHSDLSMLSEAQQLNLYDFEIVFEKENQYPDTKLKIVCGSKLFELAADSYNGKRMKFRKLVHLFLKSEDEELAFRLEKNHIEYCNLRLFTDELHGFELVKRKLSDSNTGKQVGGMKFRCEKGRSVSVPDNNRLWRESLKKRLNYTYLLSLEQPSYYLQPADEQPVHSSRLKFHVTMGTTDLPIDDVICLSNYSSGILPAHQSQKISLLNVREQGTICLAFEQQNKSSDQPKDDVEGLGVIDINDLRLGLNSLEVPLYKNQRIASYVNLLVNKVPNLQICRSDYQPEILGRLKKKTRNVSVEVSSAMLTSYFYTYEYQNKSELYCIVEINRIKKVLLLERNGSTLEFVQGEGSDYLNFVVEEMEYLRIKLTFLIADLGSEEDIYGGVSFKCRFIDLLNSGNISFAKTNIKNDCEVVVGSVSAKLVMGDTNRKSIEHEMRQLKNEMERPAKKTRANQVQSDHNLSMVEGANRYASMEAKDSKSERYSHKEPPQARSKERRNNSLTVKLPALPHRLVGRNSNKNLKTVKEIIVQVRQAKNNSQLMYPAEVREAPKNEEEEVMDETIQKLEKEVQKNRRIFAMNRLPNRKNKLAAEAPKPEKTDLGDPTIQHKFDMLFPGKFSKMKRGELQQQINQYEQQLKGLKSILTSIDKDIPDVEVEMHNNTSVHPPASNSTVEFEDNEFMAVEDNSPQHPL